MNQSTKHQKPNTYELSLGKSSLENVIHRVLPSPVQKKSGGRNRKRAEIQQAEDFIDCGQSWYTFIPCIFFLTKFRDKSYMCL